VCNDNNLFSPEECEEEKHLKIFWKKDVKNSQITTYSSKNNSGTILKVHVEDIGLFSWLATHIFNIKLK
jgi:hypothetical protein